MHRLRGSWVWLAGLGLLAACATTQLDAADSANPGCEETAEAIPFMEACRDERSLLALCGEQCGLYRCQDVINFQAAGQVVLTRGVAQPRPNPNGSAQRHWGSAHAVPRDSRPVFIIPWGPKPQQQLLPSQTEALEKAAAERNKPHEQHHIFPRALRDWFTRKDIDIDEYVMPLLVEKHRSIHRGANGGPWNAEWEKWIRENGGATKEEIFRYAGQLIYEFELFGPVMPYGRRPAQPTSKEPETP
jgi:uncharacterized lipoprotein (TIGR02269 family)